MNVRRRSTAVLLAALAVAGTLAFAGAARATICFPAGSGVPGAPGVPKWWGGASSPGRDDPRWRGAAMFNHAGDQLKARVVVDNSGADKYLVMMWSVNADPTAGNLLYFGFYNDGATPASSTGNIFRITRKDSGYQDGGTPDGGVRIERGHHGDGRVLLERQRLGGRLRPPPLPELALRRRPPGRELRNHGLRQLGHPPAGQAGDLRGRLRFAERRQRHAARSRVPVLVRIKTEFGDLSSPYSSLEFNPTVIAADPDLEDPDNFADEAALGGPRFPPPASGCRPAPTRRCPPARRGSTSTAATSRSPTRSRRAATSSRCWAPTPFTPGPRTIRARAISAGGILARFRIADWNTSSHASAIWRPVTSCGSATGSGADIANGSDFDLTCSWTLSAAERCDYAVPSGRPDGCPPATKDDHQCILVDLRTASSQFYFSSASAYRNHNFVGASEYRKKVRVDVNGLPPFAGADPNRDVYVYIQTQNMPAQVSGAAAASRIPPVAARPAGRPCSSASTSRGTGASAPRSPSGSRRRWPRARSRSTRSRS